MLARIFLEKAGYRVFVYDCVEQARRALAENEVNLILTDLGLPGEDGLTFLGWLKDSEYKNIPVLLLSGHAFGANNELVKYKDIFVQKPILFPKLIERINRILNEAD